MTTIRTFDDIVRALREQPELRDTVRQLVLTEEVLELPQKLAALAQEVQELAAAVANLTRRLDDFIETTNRNFQLVNERLDRLEADVGVLKADVGVLKADVDVIKTDIGVLKSDVSGLKASVANLNGSDAERRAQDSILNIAKDELGLTRGTVLMSRVHKVDPQLLADAERAEARGVVTEEEIDNLLVTDIIIRARRTSDRQYVYAAIEVSRTIHDHDISRAGSRARTLAAVTGEEAIAVALGDVIQPPQQLLADEQGVRVVLPAMFVE